MTLQAFIQRLDNAGFELDAEQVLDALWFASLGCDLNLHETQRQAPPDAAGTAGGRKETSTSHKPDPQWEGLRNRRQDSSGSGSLPALRRSEDTPIFARGQPASGAATRRASPVPLPAPKPLADRLALMRAFRPLTQRWPSRQFQDVDEEKTVDAYAEMAAAGMKLMLPVMRARRERWFDVEIVLEDATAIELWDDVVAELADIMRETGAFGQVRQWQLRLPRAEGRRAFLENALGVRTATTALVGEAARRLIVFVSQGITPHWSDGTYGAVLGPWLHDSAAVLLQLTPPERWVRGALGDPHGTASTTLAGAPAAALRMHTQWWRLSEVDVTPTSVPLPVVTLAPADLARWANMQMARGHGHPAYLLETAPLPHDDDDDDDALLEASVPPLPDDERAVALLKYESPDGFRLAVMLSTAPFTLTVARLVQALVFRGNTDPSLLAEVMRSGLIIDQVDGDATDRFEADVYYMVRPEARPLLQRSLRDADAIALGHQLQRELSRHLQRGSPDGRRSAQLIEDEEGTQQLPSWARPFATVATALLGLPETTSVAAQRVSDLLGRISPAAAKALSRLARTSGPIDPAQVDPDAWAESLGSRLVHQRDDGSWAFAPGVRKLLGASATAGSNDAEQADWLAAALAVLNSMALSFHMSRIVEGNGRALIREALSDWHGEQEAALRTWMAMSEYIFSGPVTTALLTGMDPIRYGEPARDALTYEKAVDALAKWINGLTGSSPSMQSGSIAKGGLVTMPYNARALPLAIRLAYARDPVASGGLVNGSTDAALRQFAAGEEAVMAGEPSWWHAHGKTILEWLHRSEVVRLLAPYCGNHFARFSIDGWSPLALCPNYYDYVEGLLSLWARATDTVFARLSSGSAVLEMGYPVDAHDLFLVDARFPEHGIVVLEEKKRRDRWGISRAGYRALIDELGSSVRAALQRRQGLPPRRPCVLWVDDHPGNNEGEREYFSSLQIDFVLATSTDEAVGLCRSHLYDAVLSDMGRASDARAGLTLLRSLRRSGNRVPFVVYSARREPHGELLDWGALGVSDESDMLRGLLVRALLRQDEALDRAVDESTLAQYAERQFGYLDVSREVNARINEWIDPHAYPTLAQVHQAVEHAWPALAAWAHEYPEWFGTGSDYVIAALSLTNQEFARRSGFSTQAAKMLAKFSPLISGGDEADEDDADEDKLRESLSNAVRAGALSVLDSEIQRELQNMVESAQWEVEADTHYFYEAEDVHAELLSWEFEGNGEDRFELSGWHDGVVDVSAHITFRIRAHASFTFSIRDSIDKDMVGIGYAEPSRELEVEGAAQASLRRIGAGEFDIESVTIMKIPTYLNFGPVEPDEDQPDPDEYQ